MGKEGQDKRDDENSGVVGALLKHVYPQCWFQTSGYYVQILKLTIWVSFLGPERGEGKSWDTAATSANGCLLCFNFTAIWPVSSLSTSPGRQAEQSLGACLEIKLGVWSIKRFGSAEGLGKLSWEPDLHKQTGFDMTKAYSGHVLPGIRSLATFCIHMAYL